VLLKPEVTILYIQGKLADFKCKPAFVLTVVKHKITLESLLINYTYLHIIIVDNQQADRLLSIDNYFKLSNKNMSSLS